MKNIHVNVSENPYEVKIGDNIVGSCLDKICQKYNQKDIFIVTNDTIEKLYPNYLEKVLPEELLAHKLILPDGEKYKNLENLHKIYDFLVEKKANRKSIIIAFGGGVIGDITGFAASSFMRGINFIQIPTTLLSQVDSSIGGKTAVNHEGGKNIIGAFKQPYQTVIDVSFLKTLPDREFRAGYAELIKHGFIQDAYLCNILKRESLDKLKEDTKLLIDSIFRSVEVKARVVEQDEKEVSIRAILNFGHTLAHFLETYTKYEKYLHGEALIAGMDFANWWSHKRGILPEDSYKIVKNHLGTLNYKIDIPEINRDCFLDIIGRDKKAESTGVKFIALLDIGRAQVIHDVTVESLWDDFNKYLHVEDCLIKVSSN